MLQSLMLISPHLKETTAWKQQAKGSNGSSSDGAYSSSSLPRRLFVQYQPYDHSTNGGNKKTQDKSPKQSSDSNETHLHQPEQPPPSPYTSIASSLSFLECRISSLNSTVAHDTQQTQRACMKQIEERQSSIECDLNQLQQSIICHQRDQRVLDRRMMQQHSQLCEAMKEACIKMGVPFEPTPTIEAIPDADLICSVAVAATKVTPSTPHQSAVAPTAVKKEVYYTSERKEQANASTSLLPCPLSRSISPAARTTLSPITAATQIGKQKKRTRHPTFSRPSESVNDALVSVVDVDAQSDSDESWNGEDNETPTTNKRKRKSKSKMTHPQTPVVASIAPPAVPLQHLRSVAPSPIRPISPPPVRASIVAASIPALQISTGSLVGNKRFTLNNDVELPTFTNEDDDDTPMNDPPSPPASPLTTTSSQQSTITVNSAKKKRQQRSSQKKQRTSEFDEAERFINSTPSTIKIESELTASKYAAAVASNNTSWSTAATTTTFTPAPSSSQPPRLVTVSFGVRPKVVGEGEYVPRGRTSLRQVARINYSEIDEPSGELLKQFETKTIQPVNKKSKQTRTKSNN